jgi:hypothetical protein
MSSGRQPFLMCFAVAVVTTGPAVQAAEFRADYRPACEGAEVDARDAKPALWSLPNPKPPWEVRHPTPGTDDGRANHR